MEAWGKKRERKIWFSITLVEMKVRGNNMECIEFFTWAYHFFFSKMGNKDEKTLHWEKKNYKTTHTFSLFFNNKGIIVIYSLFIHFYIPSTKHTWQQTNVFFYRHNIFYHSTFPSFLPKNLLVKSHHRPNEKDYSIGREFTDQTRNITLLEENPLMVGFLCLPKCD